MRASIKSSPRFLPFLVDRSFEDETICRCCNVSVRDFEVDVDGKMMRWMTRNDDMLAVRSEKGSSCATSWRVVTVPNDGCCEGQRQDVTFIVILCCNIFTSS